MEGIIMNNISLSLAAYSVIVGLIGFAMNPSPIVKLDRETGNCIEVVSKESNHSCSNLPDSYKTELTQE